MLTKQTVIIEVLRIIKDNPWQYSGSKSNPVDLLLVFPASSIFGNDSQRSNLENIPTEIVKLLFFSQQVPLAF